MNSHRNNLTKKKNKLTFKTTWKMMKFQMIKLNMITNKILKIKQMFLYFFKKQKNKILI